MQIQINNQLDAFGRVAELGIRSKIEAAFTKYTNKVKSVMLTAKDLNGPKGGIDKQCRVLVRVNGIGEVVATGKHESLSQAISTAIKRAERSVAKRIRKVSKVSSRRRQLRTS